ncbi:MAG TPA: hypothetical protein VE244_07325 [Nitrososphaeraceae archaeon]|nr:hypothetical protein [Nitrososphaeraceae archaeon]
MKRRQKKKTEIIDTGIAAGSVNRRQQLQSMEFIFSPNSSKITNNDEFS